MDSTANRSQFISMGKSSKKKSNKSQNKKKSSGKKGRDREGTGKGEGEQKGGNEKGSERSNGEEKQCPEAVNLEETIPGKFGPADNPMPSNDCFPGLLHTKTIKLDWTKTLKKKFFYSDKFVDKLIINSLRINQNRHKYRHIPKIQIKLTETIQNEAVQKEKLFANFQIQRLPHNIELGIEQLKMANRNNAANATDDGDDEKDD